MRAAAAAAAAAAARRSFNVKETERDAVLASLDSDHQSPPPPPPSTYHRVSEVTPEKNLWVSRREDGGEITLARIYDHQSYS